MKKSYLAIAVVSLLSYTSFSQAQSVSSDDVETLVVTANRFEQSIKNVITPVEVVTKEEIDSIQAKSLTEVLSRLPGIQVSGGGGIGQTKSVYVRGTNSSHVLMLLNGVRMGSATLGSGNFGSIPLTGIERIEYIRGSCAAVYGADAVGGVINIITDYQKGQKLSEFSVGVGSNSYRVGKVSSAGEISDKLWGKVVVNKENSDGFSASSTSGQEDDDGYENRDIVAELGGDITSKFSLRATAYYHDGHVEFDSPEESNKDVIISNFSVGAEYTGEQVRSSLTISENTDRDKTYDTGNDGTTQTDRQTINWQNLYKFNDIYSIGGGIDWYKSDISESTSTYEKTDQSNTGYYLMGFYDTDVVQAEANIRSDDNEEYGVNNTWQLGFAWAPASGYRLTASAGSAFKAPSLNDLYYPVTCFPSYGCYGGNADLKPEESESAEFGFEADLDIIQFRAALYQQEIKNLIVWGNIPDNVSEARIRGIELSGSFNTGVLDHNVILEYMDPEDRETGNQLVRRSKESVKWQVSYFGEAWQLDASYRYQGKSYDDADNDDKLGSYSLVDISAGYFVTDNITLRGKIENLLDKDYVVSKEYNTAERSYYATVSYQF